MAICLQRSADLHVDVIQLMPLPLTVSCSSKIQTGFTFLAPAYPGSPGQRAVERVCVCAQATDIHMATALPSVLSTIFHVNLQVSRFPSRGFRPQLATNQKF